MAEKKIDDEIEQTAGPGDLELEDMDEFEEEGGLWKKVLVWGGSILGGLLIIVIILVIGFFIGRGSVDEGPAEVQSIKSQNAVLDSLDNLKDSQVKALNQQLADLQSRIETGDVDATDEKLNAPKGSADIINSFVDTFYAMPYQADQAQQDQVRDALNSQGDVSGVQDQQKGQQKRDTLGQRVVAGDSPAKQLKATGKRAGEATLFYSDRDADGNPVLVGMVPFATETQVHETLFVAKVRDDKVADFQFVGVVSGKSETFDQARARMVEKN